MGPRTGRRPVGIVWGLPPCPPALNGIFQKSPLIAGIRTIGRRARAAAATAASGPAAAPYPALGLEAEKTSRSYGKGAEEP